LDHWIVFLGFQFAIPIQKDTNETMKFRLQSKNRGRNALTQFQRFMKTEKGIQTGKKLSVIIQYIAIVSSR